MIDKNQIYVKDYHEIIMMDSHIFSIRMDQYLLNIKGKDLEMYYYDHEELRLHGYVKVIEYDENRV